MPNPTTRLSAIDNAKTRESENPISPTPNSESPIRRLRLSFARSCFAVMVRAASSEPTPAADMRMPYPLEPACRMRSA